MRRPGITIESFRAKNKQNLGFYYDFKIFLGTPIALSKVETGGFMGGLDLVGIIRVLLDFIILLLLLVIAIRLQAIILILRKMQKIKIKFLDESSRQ